MERTDFKKLVEESIIPKCMQIMESKGLAYSGRDDALANFKRNAKLTGSTPEQVWFIYFMKHVDAISAYVRGEYSDSEPIEGRIQDIINYGMLLYGLVKENEKKS